MWDSNSPMKLLKTMPKKLTKENLEKLQLIIDADKYKNSLISGFDLCGMYAPFCKGCKKTSIYPCAVAYVNMVQADGMDIEIDAKPILQSTHGESNEVKNVEGERLAEEPLKAEHSPVKEPLPTTEPQKRKIRIAVARKKF